MDLSRSAPFLNVRLFFCFNSELYDRGKILFFVASEPAAGAFYVKNYVFVPGTLPLAPFFVEKIRFWCWSVAAGAFFWWKKNFGCHRRLFPLQNMQFLRPVTC